MPAGIKFACPHCGRACKVPYELAGKQGRCPGCRRGLEVPLPDSSKALPALPSSPSTSARSPVRSAPDRSTSKRTSRRTSKRASKRVSDQAEIPVDLPSRSAPGRSGRASKATTPEAEPFVHPDSIVPDSVVLDRSGAPVVPAPPTPDPDEETNEERHKSTSELQGIGTETCRACKMEIPANSLICPICKADLRPKDGVVPWQVWFSMLCFLPAPLPGLVFAQWGLRVSRKRRANELPAWISVFLNGVFLVFGTLYMVRKAIMA